MRWCLPALVVGAVLRVMLWIDLPFALLHDDTPDYLSTTNGLLHHGELSVHEKKTFLYPLFLTAHTLLPIPALRTLPLTQHALGLAVVLLVGGLVQAWCRKWRWWIVPITLLTAANPYLLWYEHTLMAESLFVFATVVLAAAGTFYAMRRSGGAFALLCGALVLEAGARPEGKLLFGFALLLLVSLHWRERRLLGRRLMIFSVVALATHLVTRTEQAGLLLYTSLARLTPERLTSAPGFEPYIAPVRAGLQHRWEARRSFPGAEDRRDVARVVKTYLKETGRGGSSEKFCQRLAMETCARSFVEMPRWFLQKLQATASLAPGGRFNRDWMVGAQKDAWTSDFAKLQKLAPRLAGRPFATESDVEAFLEENYPSVRWFNRWHTRWTDAAAAIRFPVRDAPHVVPGRRLQGVPVYFALAAAGAFALMLRRGTLQPFHIAWGLAFAALFVVIFLTANIRPRFRIAYEPFWLLYLAAGLDALFSRARASSADRSDPPANR